MPQGYFSIKQLASLLTAAGITMVGRGAAFP